MYWFGKDKRKSDPRQTLNAIFLPLIYRHKNKVEISSAPTIMDGVSVDDVGRVFNITPRTLEIPSLAKVSPQDKRVEPFETGASYAPRILGLNLRISLW